MKLICKWLSLMLAICLIVSALSVNSYAQTSPEELPQMYYAEGSMDPNPADAGAPVEEHFVCGSLEPQTYLSDGEYFDSVEDAAAVLRAAMRERRDSVRIKFKTSVDCTYQEAAKAVWNTAMVHTGVPTEGDYLMKQWGPMNYSVGYYSDSTTTYYDITYTVNYYTSAQQEQEVDTAVAELLSQLALDGKSDYEKVCAVYQWMCSNIVYDYDNLSDPNYKLKYTAYAALINRTSVCQGYALLFYRLMLELGIDCRIVSGWGNGGAHAWNIVRLNGKYYNVDATWDASWYTALGRYEWFLRCDETFVDHVRNEEFDSAEFRGAYPMGDGDYDPNAVPEPEPEPEKNPGDINGDGKVNSKDATRLFQYLSDWDVEVNEATLDVNGDGKVNNKDATRLFQYLSGWDVEIH